MTSELFGELDLERQDEVATRVVHHERREWVVIVDGHALSLKDFLELWRDHFVRSELDHLAVQGLELNSSDSQGIGQ